MPDRLRVVVRAGSQMLPMREKKHAGRIWAGSRIGARAQDTPRHQKPPQELHRRVGASSPQARASAELGEMGHGGCALCIQRDRRDQHGRPHAAGSLRRHPVRGAAASWIAGTEHPDRLAHLRGNETAPVWYPVSHHHSMIRRKSSHRDSASSACRSTAPEKSPVPAVHLRWLNRWRRVSCPLLS